MDYELEEMHGGLNTSFGSSSNSTVVDLYREHILLEVARFLVCLLGTIVELLIIYIILKYKNMKRPTNIYIMNWLICDAVTIVLEPSIYRIMAVVDNTPIGNYIACLTYDFTTALQTVSLFFMLALLFQWLFDNTRITFLDRHCPIVVFALWIVGVGVGLINTVMCMEGKASYFSDYLLLILLLAFAICMVIIHILRKCSNPFTSTTALPIALVSSYALCWVGVMLIVMISTLYAEDLTTAFYVYKTCMILVYLYPLLLFYLFHKIDKQFGICLRLLFRMSDNRDEVACFDSPEEGEHLNNLGAPKETSSSPR